MKAWPCPNCGSFARYIGRDFGGMSNRKSAIKDCAGEFYQTFRCSACGFELSLCLIETQWLRVNWDLYKDEIVTEVTLLVGEEIQGYCEDND